MTELVEVRPLKPFVGSFKCSLSESDMIDDGLEQNEQGQIVKVKVPKKRFIGLIPVQRAMRPPEHDLWLKGQLPEHLEPNENGTMVIEHPAERTIKVPADVASSLVTRGLAELVAKEKAARGTKPSAVAA